MKTLKEYIFESDEKSKLIRELGKLLKRGEKYDWRGGFDGYYYSPEDMNKLNPLFGFKDGDSKRGLGSKGVASIWMRDYNERPRKMRCL